MLEAKYHRYIYLFGIAVLLVGMPLSPVLMSVSQMILLGNWIIEGDFKNKLSKFKNNIPALLIVIFYALHIIWLVNTSDFSYALKDLRVKLPLLVLPFVFASGIRLSKEEFKHLLQVYVAGIVMASFACMMKLWGWIGEPVTETRKMSFIISHIRFGLMIDMAIFCVGWLFMRSDNTFVRVLYIATIGWLVTFLGIMTGLTALLVLAILTVLLSLYWVFTSQNKLLAGLTTTACVVGVASIVGMSITEYEKQFGAIEEGDIETLDKKTSYGNRYYHSPTSVSLENGNYVYRYICEIEIEQAWAKRSSIPWNGSNKKGKDIRGAMYRFLSSKGLRKDKDGIDALSDQEVTAIENGVTSVDLMGRGALYHRLHQTIWEIGNYNLGIPAGGNSLTQRFEFWKAALAISKENLWFGVGTGDVKQSYQEFYEKEDFGLGEKYHKRAHNQYLTFLLTFGVIGFIFFLVSMLYPLFTKQHLLFYLFMGTILISYLNEDTLESQAGATFFAGFFGLLLDRFTPESKPV